MFRHHSSGRGGDGRGSSRGGGFFFLFFLLHWENGLDESRDAFGGLCVLLSESVFVGEASEKFIRSLVFFCEKRSERVSCIRSLPSER